jgi:hypothetical protein
MQQAQLDHQADMTKAQKKEEVVIGFNTFDKLKRIL